MKWEMLTQLIASYKCDFIWGEPIRKKKRVHKGITYTSVYPTDSIRQIKF